MRRTILFFVSAAVIFLASGCDRAAGLNGPRDALATDIAAQVGEAAAVRSPEARNPQSWPNTADGKPITQLGLYDIAYWDLEDKFLNLLRAHDGGFAAANKWPNRTVIEFPALYVSGAIDRASLVPTRIPPGFDHIRSGLFRAGARYYPAYYAGTYVFDWEGDGEARCGLGAGGTRKISATRIECDYPATKTEWATIEITRIGAGFRNPRLYRKENEALINQGEVFDPRFLSFIGRYKIIRTMDTQDTNMSWVRSVDELATKQALSWGGHEGWSAERQAAGAPKGVPIEALFDMAVASDTALWMNIPGIIGAPKIFVDEAEALRSYYPVETGRDRLVALARTHAKEIIASPEWRRYADEIVRAAIASGYPETRTLYIELWNEVWNNANPWWRMTHYCVGLAEGIGDVEAYSSKYAYGYMAANFAVHFEAALKAQGRAQASAIVLAGQMANPETTRAALLGFRRYFRDRGIDAAPYLARAGVAAASYFYDGGAFDLKNGVFPAASEAARDAAWLAAINSDPAGLARQLTDRIVDGAPSDFGSLAWMISFRAQHQALAEKAGAFFLGDYEGHDHLAPPASLAVHPTFVNWFEDWRAGPEGERLTRAWGEALLAQNPDAVISNYLSIGARDPEGAAPTDKSLSGPWIDHFWDEETGRTKAFDGFLREPAP